MRVGFSVKARHSIFYETPLEYLLRREKSGNGAARKRRQADADKAMDEMVGRNADNCDAYLARWRYRREFE